VVVTQLLSFIQLSLEVALYFIGWQMVTPNSYLFGSGPLGSSSELLLSEKFVVLVHCQVVFFKMHSYLLTNLDLRNEYDKRKAT